MSHVIGDRNYWQQRTLDISEEVGRGKLWFWPRQIEAESDFDVHALSPMGAQGIGQFMPGTAASRRIDPWNPEQALRGSAQLVSEYLERFGNPVDALIAYNAGPARVTPGDPKYLPRDMILSDDFAGGETKRYVAKILGDGPGVSQLPATGTCPRIEGHELFPLAAVLWSPEEFRRTAQMIADRHGTTIECVRQQAYRNAGDDPYVGVGPFVGGVVRKAFDPVLGELAKATDPIVKALPEVLLVGVIIVVALKLAGGGLNRILPSTA